MAGVRDTDFATREPDRTPTLRSRLKPLLHVIAVALLAAGPPALALEASRPIDSYAIETWSTDEGLPHNLVHAIAQTPDGYLWFGSWEGIARFNAWEFRVFDADHDGVLRNNGVRALARAPDGALWAGTSEGGVTRFADGRWTQFGEAEGLETGSIRSLLVARDGRVYVGTEDRGVLVYDGRPGSNGRFAPLPAELPNALVLALGETRDGSILIGTLRGLARWKDGALLPVPAFPAGAQPSIFAVHEDAAGVLRVGTERGLYRVLDGRVELETGDAPLAEDSVSAIVQDRDGSLWVGTFQSGLTRVRERRVERLTQAGGLPHNRVAALYEDQEGSLWVGTGLGLARLADAPFITMDRRHGLSDDYVRSITEDASGTLWVGTGDGLNRYDGHAFDPLYPGGQGAAGSSIMALYPARDGTLWVGTRDAGAARWDGKTFAFLSPAEGLAGKQVRSLRETRDGSMWIGTSTGISRVRDGEITNFGEAEGLPRAYVTALYEDADGIVWAGTSAGTAVFDRKRFHAFDKDPQAPRDDVFDFHQDANGGLWIATTAGLYRYRDGRFAAIDAKAGNLPRQLFAILEDHLGYLWLSSNSGVHRVSRGELDAVAEGRAPTYDSVRYGHRDGMGTNQCNGSSQPAAWKSRDGRLWFSTAAGAVVVDPRRADVGAVQPPPIVVERVLVDGEAPQQVGSFEVPPDAKRVTIEYAALAYRRPEHVDYRFRLVGYESEWVPVGPRRSTVYTNLPPGDYRFEVEPDERFPGFEPVSATTSFRVLPRFYQRPWFIAGMAALVAGLALLVYRLRVAELMRRKQELERQVTERTEALAEETRKLKAASEEKNELLDKVREQSHAFERLSREDALTRLPNRRHADTLLRDAFARCRDERRPISVAVLDLDRFKQINDRHSHAIGDETLRTVARLMTEVCAGVGTPARYGGEEFVIAFPGVAAAMATRCCERLREAVEKYDWSRVREGLAVTISVGVSDSPEAATHERLIALADARLYEAKGKGRNVVVGEP